MPVDGPVGIRHIGGMTLIQASVRNLGTCRPDAKRPFQKEPRGAVNLFGKLLTLAI